MFPIGDQNEPGQRVPFVTIAIILLNLAVFFLIQLNDDSFTYGYSAIPAEITQGRDIVEPQVVTVNGQREVVPEAPGPEPIYLTLLTSMFMHGGYAHIFGNMLFLFIFGDNVEHRMGRLPFLLFYLAAGVIASLAQIAVNPGSVVPTLGASGAISGVLGAYLVLFPRNRVSVIVFNFIPYAVPALVAIGMWAALQFVNGFGQIALTEETGGVAYLAHVGGFVTGLLVGFAYRATRGPQARYPGWR